MNKIFSITIDDKGTHRVFCLFNFIKLKLRIKPRYVEKMELELKALKTIITSMTDINAYAYNNSPEVTEIGDEIMNKIFSITIDDKGTHRVFCLFNFIKLKLRIKPRYVQEMEQEIKSLRKIINLMTDITKYPVATDKLREHQLLCNELLKMVKSICKNNDLDYWLCSGTLLGAVRHKGFIPWDNDVDLCMPRQSFDRALKILDKEFQNTDFWVRKRAKNDNNYQIRIINKYNYKLGIDIFPVDSYFKNYLTPPERKFLTDRIKEARKIFAKKYPRGPKTPAQVIKAKEYLLKIRDEYILENCEAKKDGALFYALDYPYTLAKLLCMDYETVYPLKEIEFEGEMYSCPNNIEEYLTNLYGDYMAYPRILK